MSILTTDRPAILAHRCDWNDSTIVVVHDLAGRPATLSLALDLPDDAEALDDLFSADSVPLRDGGVELALEAHAHRWFRVRRRGRRLAP